MKYVVFPTFIWQIWQVLFPLLCFISFLICLVFSWWWWILWKWIWSMLLKVVCQIFFLVRLFFTNWNMAYPSQFPLVKTSGLHGQNTVAYWDCMGRVITQTRGWSFQALGWAFTFLLNPHRLGRVFQMLGGVFVKVEWASQRLGRMFWNKCSAESFDQRTH